MEIVVPLSLPNAYLNTKLFIQIISIARDLFPEHEFVKVVVRGVEWQTDLNEIEGESWMDAHPEAECPRGSPCSDPLRTSRVWGCAVSPR